MSEESVRNHLRAALGEVISAEKASLHEKFAVEDAIAAHRVKMMQPLIKALESFKAEVGERKGLTIFLYPDSATITLGSTTYNVSTNESNSAFEVVEIYITDIAAYCHRKDHEFSSAEDAVKLIVDAVGKDIALEQVMRQRFDEGRYG